MTQMKEELQIAKRFSKPTTLTISFIGLGLTCSVGILTSLLNKDMAATFKFKRADNNFRVNHPKVTQKSTTSTMVSDSEFDDYYAVKEEDNDELDFTVNPDFNSVKSIKVKSFKLDNNLPQIF